jgi:hypothetical protein
VKTSIFVQNVDKYPWEYDDAIRRLQESLNNYATLLGQLDLNTTQEMDSIEGKTLFYTVECILAFYQHYLYHRISTRFTSYFAHHNNNY